MKTGCGYVNCEQWAKYVVSFGTPALGGDSEALCKKHTNFNVRDLPAQGLGFELHIVSLASWEHTNGAKWEKPEMVSNCCGEPYANTNNLCCACGQLSTPVLPFPEYQ